MIAPDRRGLLSKAAGVLALNSLRVHSASVNGDEGSAIQHLRGVTAFRFTAGRRVVAPAVSSSHSRANSTCWRSAGQTRPRRGTKHGTSRAGGNTGRGAHQPRLRHRRRSVVGRVLAWRAGGADPYNRPCRPAARLDGGCSSATGVDIAWAKVTTLGSSVVDVFGITDVGDGDSAGTPTSVIGSMRDELRA